MKRNIFFVSITLFIHLCALISCVDNKDNDINDNIDFIENIDNIADSYTLYLGDVLQISPTVEFNSNQTDQDYEYRWVIGYNQIISTDKDLVWDIILPKGCKLQETIQGVFVAKNKSNGLEFRKTFTAEIYTGYTPTYMVVYETGVGTIDWLSIQGESPRAFTRFFDSMSQRVNGQAISGNYKGAIISKSELSIFTDHAPDFGYSISMVDPSTGSEFQSNLGELIAPITERIYRGALTNPDFHNIAYGDGGSKTIMIGDKLYIFNGLESKLPMFDDATYLKGENVENAMMSKQFIRYKKVNVVHYKDRTLGAFFTYTDNMDMLTTDGSTPFVLDSLIGMFAESTALASNKPYSFYLIGKVGTDYNMYIFDVVYVGTKVQPIQYKKMIPLPSSIGKNAKFWFSSFAQKYGFYVENNQIYKFDYLNMTSFPSISSPFISFPSKYEVVDVFPLVPGSGLKNEDDCVVVLLYDAATNKSSIYVYETVSGAKIEEYTDVIPGRGVYFIKRK